MELDSTDWSLMIKIRYGYIVPYLQLLSTFSPQKLPCTALRMMFYYLPDQSSFTISLDHSSALDVVDQIFYQAYSTSAGTSRATITRFHLHLTDLSFPVCPNCELIPHASQLRGRGLGFLTFCLRGPIWPQPHLGKMPPHLWVKSKAIFQC